MWIDLAKPPFWVALLVGYLLLTPLTRWEHRKRVQALLNLSFVLVIGGPTVMLATVLLLVFLRWLLSQLCQSDSRVAGATACGLLLLSLFLLAKVEPLSRALTVPEVTRILMGLGYSYILLRAIFLIRDLFEERCPLPSLVELVNYLIPFHMLAAGPIQTYQEHRQRELPCPNRRDLLEGAERISTGLFKKFVLADSIRWLFLTDFQHPDPWYFVMEIQWNYIWLYLDFSGYSDIAVGVGRLLGVRTPENFDRPLLARNLIVFWERWHITLSRFIRLNIFMPAQLHLVRRGYGMGTAAAITFTLAFVLCGLWHAISWRFLCWGFLHGAGLAVCKLAELRMLKKRGRKGRKEFLENRFYHWLGILLTFEFVALSWLLVTLPSERLWNLI